MMVDGSTYVNTDSYSALHLAKQSHKSIHSV